MSYKDATLPIEQRVDDLLAQMTLEEKVAQLCCVMPRMLIGEQVPDPALMIKHMANGLGRMAQFSMIFVDNPEQIAEFANRIQKFVLENTRLGIPLMFQNEALNGFVAVGATNFPTPIALASTWEPELVEQAAQVIREQMRATGVHIALAPVIDLAQDPRWGRGHETFGEDPYLSSAFGAAFTHGLQSDDLRTGVISCAKHFLGYSISQGGLNMAAVHIGERELYETFARPFETAIHESDLGMVMVTYSEIDGQPVSVNKNILRDLLRDTMGFKGSATCDGGSIELTVTKQHVAKNMQEAAIMAIEAGLDGDTPVAEAYYELVGAVNQGLVDVAYVDEAVRRILTIKFKLGLFENPFVDVNKVRTAFENPAHRQLSRKLAEQSITLLKNDADLLPLKNAKTIAVIGPHADSVRDSLFAGYTFPAMMEMMKNLRRGGRASMQGVSDKVAEQDDKKKRPEFFVALGEMGDINQYIEKEYDALSLRDAIAQRQGVEVIYAKGCGITDPSKDGFAEAINAAQKSDVVVVALGGRSGWGKECTCGEGRDASTIELMGVQQELLQAIHATGKPIVLVLFDGRPLAIPWAADASHIPAILHAWFPGQAGGEALADVLFGEVNPGGKLPVTIPRSTGQVPLFYNHKAGSGYQTIYTEGVTAFLGYGYVNESNLPLYAFGHGLSYTRFEFSDLQLSAKHVDATGEIAIACSVKNVGAVAGSEVVQLYLHDCEARVTRPVQELVGFKRVELQPGERCKVTFTVKMNQLGFYNHNMQFAVEPGNMEVMIGASSADIRLKGAFEITGETVQVLGKRSYLSRVHVER
ncbi:MAG: glycoside hydrolase family 3 C-terminal domain-containing protein [Chloroflexi bacterium]|nr:glycoside hydrolase family 3 C-terminal domain-containing protein [Chloroflexota bacterium]